MRNHNRGKNTIELVGTVLKASSDIVPDSNKCIPDKHSESGVLVVKKGNSLNKGISFSWRK